MRAARSLLMGVLASTAAVHLAAAATIQVPADQPTIQAGIAAAVNGDTVLVAPGTYDEAIDFLGKSIEVESSGGADVTSVRPPTHVTAVRLANTGAGTALRGFTIRGAAPPPLTPTARTIDALSSGAVVEGNVITDAYSCTAPGIMASGGTVVRRNVIHGNRHGCTGGGLASIVEIYSGAAFTDNLVVGNAYGNAAVGVDDGGVVTANVIAGNTPVDAALLVEGGHVANNLVTGNAAVRAGGLGLNGFGTGLVVNNTFADNTGNLAQEIWVQSVTGLGNYTLRNNAFANASGPLITCEGGSTGPTLANNAFDAGGGSVVASTSTCLDPTGTSGNFVAGSSFVDRTRGDFHLSTTSPLLDAGEAADAPATDWDGDPRPLDGSAGPSGAQWDIGFDEGVEAGNGVQTMVTGGPEGVVGREPPAFTFTSPTAGAAFECDLDMAGFAPCTSPLQTHPVASRIHSFRVRAVGPGGAVDRTPAMRLFEVDADCTQIGSDQSEVLSGSAAEDMLCGRGGDDLLEGLGGADVLRGEDGDDLLTGGPGPDVIDGGPGVGDTVDYSERTTPVTVKLGDGIPDGGAEDGAGDTIDPSVEDIWGGSAGDVLAGDGGDNLIDGGLGSDQISGGDGFDFADYSTATTSVTADPDGIPADDGRVGEGDTIATDVEGIIGGSAGDVLSGDIRGEVLAGGPGNDQIAGGPGSDLLLGDEGDDTILAADGEVDEIDCGPGVDTVVNDPFDFVTNCESASASGPPPPPTAPRPPVVPSTSFFTIPIRPSTAPPPVARRSIFRLMMLKGIKGSSRAGITVPVRCQSTATRCRIRLIARTTLKVRGGKRTLIVGGLTRYVPRGTRRVLVKLNRRAAILFRTRSGLRVRVHGSIYRDEAFRSAGTRTVVVKRVTRKEATKSTPERR